MGARQALLMTVMIGLCAVIASCRDDEQNRPMVKQKGVYEGVVDEKLDEGRLSDLRSRTAGQKF